MAQNEIETEVLHRYIDTVLKATGWSQNELARKAGVDPSTVSRMLSGARKARRMTLEAIARATKTPLPPELALAGDPDFVGLGVERADRLPVFALLGSPIQGLWYRSEAHPDSVVRPAALVDSRAAYAIRTPDATMAPWRQPNELIVVNPTWAVAEGDHVLVETSHPSDPNHARSLYRIRRYLGPSRQGVRLRCYAKDAEELVPNGEPANLFRIMEWQDVAGIR